MDLGNELYHHGIDGQKWGKKNGPPYPLSRAEHRRVVRSAKAAKKRNLSYDSAKRNVRKMTDDDLDLALERLRREKEYAQLVSGKYQSEKLSKEQQESRQIYPVKKESRVKEIALEATKKATLGLIANLLKDQATRLSDARREQKEALKRAQKDAEYQKNRDEAAKLNLFKIDKYGYMQPDVDRLKASKTALAKNTHKVNINKSATFYQPGSTTWKSVVGNSTANIKLSSIRFIPSAANPGTNWAVYVPNKKQGGNP